jgi:hypothetical protein
MQRVTPETTRASNTARSILSRHDLWAAVLFAALAALHTWPVVRAPFDETIRSTDTLMNVWALRELTHQLLSDPLDLLDGNAFHPYTQHTIAMVDHMFANAVLVAPLWLLTGHALFIYNIALLATYVLSGLLTYKLVAELTDSKPAGLVAGVAFAFAIARSQQVTHLHAASTQWLPLALLLLHRLLENPTRRRLAAFTGATLLVALSSWHVALFGVFSLGCLAIWTMAGDGRPIVRRVSMLAAAAFVVFLAIVPFALSYVSAASAWKPEYTPAERLHELQSHSLSVEALVAADPQTAAPYARALARFGVGEWRGFPGIVTAMLACVSLVVLARGGRPGRRYRWLMAAIGFGVSLLALGVGLARSGQPALANALAGTAPVVILSVGLFVAGMLRARTAGRQLAGEEPGAAPRRLATLAYAAIVVVGALLALGPAIQAAGIPLGSGVYREDWLPILSILRTPGRFVMLVALGAAVLAGFGTRLILGWLPARWRAAGAGALLVVLNLDLAVAPLVMDAAPRANRAVHNWLRRAPMPGSVIEYPLGRSLWWMYLSPAHGRPLVNGSGYVRPPMFDALPPTADLSREQLDILWEHFHPRFAVVRGSLYAHKSASYSALLASAATQPEAIAERARFGEDRIFELTDNGRGPLLFRRWPREALTRTRALTFTSVVSGASPGTLTALEVTFNGHPMLRVEGPEAEAWSQRTAAYEQEWLVPGVNTFEIRGNYRLPIDTAARPIGGTGGSLRADVSVTSTRLRSWIQVNGRFLRGDKGYLLAVLDPDTGQIRSEALFNTSWYREDSRRLARFVDAIPAGTPVAIASEFDVSRALTGEAVTALQSLGFREDLRSRFNVLHAGIGVKGARPGTALESVSTETATLTIGSPQTRTVELRGLALH